MAVRFKPHDTIAKSTQFLFFNKFPKNICSDKMGMGDRDRERDIYI